MALQFGNSLIQVCKPMDKADRENFITIVVQHGKEGITSNVCYLYNIPLDLAHEEHAPYRLHFGKECEETWLNFLDNIVDNLDLTVLGHLPLFTELERGQ